MTDNVDPRAVRARRALVDAFEKAVLERSPEEITVSALCRAAGVNRSTFYQHFASPDDVALQSLGDVFDLVRDADIVLRSAGSPVAPAEASRRAITGVVTFLAARRALFARLLGPTGPARVRDAVTTAFVDHSIDALSRMAGRPDDVDLTVVARFLAGGVLGVVGQWLAEPESDRTAEALVEELLLCLPSWLMDARHRPDQ
jgi:AcrR family transcriptional regulator